MKPLVLNAWPKTLKDESRIFVEATASPSSVEVHEPVIDAGGDYRVSLLLHGVGLAMAPDDILVADGLIRKVRVSAGPAQTNVGGLGRPDGQAVRLDVFTEHKSAPSFTIVPGMPARIEFSFPRLPLFCLLGGITIAIDPGHGGKDAGIRGPVNLLEKDVVLDIARPLEKMLSECGANVIMSRDDDTDVDVRGWAVTLGAAEPELLVEIHASGEGDPLSRNYHVFARRDSDASERGASEIAGALTERMGITFQGVEPSDFPAIPIFPAVRVQPVCLTHFVDEANFRAPLFRKRIAQAIFNGICRYLNAAQGNVARVG